MELAAYRLPWGAAMRLEPAELSREWMTATRFGNAYHCLPLSMANQGGWWLLNCHDFAVSWSGEKEASSLHIEYEQNSDGPYPASSHFGYGILTFAIPYIFRTSPGWNLLVRGPANIPKDGAAPLEGLVETDWSPFTFTMNWQITRAGMQVRFRPGEPICMIVPRRRGELEAVQPLERDLAQLPEAEQYLQWRKWRHEFREAGGVGARRWQHDYLTGRDLSGEEVSDHQRRLILQRFESDQDADTPVAGPGCPADSQGTAESCQTPES